ncbi:MAG: hypothetical protein MUP19_06725, partial [Candidatus Aminicenantes bacterium]|nr:hypothetical protein [Candidatus Aminicenantes bacterium]
QEEALRRDAEWQRTRGGGALKQLAKAIFKQVGAEVRSIDEKTRTIWHKITSEVRDRLGDIVRIDGIDTKDFLRKPAVLYGHDYKSMNPVPVIGKNVGFQVSGRALYAGTRFLNPKEVSSKLGDLVNDCWLLNKEKLLGWSVGFIPVPGETRDNIEDGRVVGKDYLKTELLEYSNVIIPANQEAVNDALKRGLVSKALTGYESKLAPEGPVYYYELVDERQVDRAKVAAVNETLSLCMRKLKIQSIDLAWFRVVDAGTPGAKILGPRRNKAFVLIGGDRDPMVHLRTDLSKFDLQLAAAHECHHLFLENAPKDRYASLDAEDRENCADAFAFLMWDDLRSRRQDRPEASRNW